MCEGESQIQGIGCQILINKIGSLISRLVLVIGDTNLLSHLLATLGVVPEVVKRKPKNTSCCEPYCDRSAFPRAAE